MNRPNQTPQVVEPKHWNRPGRPKLSRIAGVLTAAVVISWGGPPANAFWQTLGTNAGVAQADSIPAVATPAASVSAGSALVTWKQGTTAAGRPVTGYTVARYLSSTGGTKVAAAGGCAGTITSPSTSLSCSEAFLPAGTWYYTVTPLLGAWVGVESFRSGGVAAADAAPPTAPTVTAAATANSANVASVPVTAEPGSSARMTAPDTPPAGTTPQAATQVSTATGFSQTTIFDLSTFRDGAIVYTAVAADAAGDASTTETASSTKDTTAPRVTALVLDNGGATFTPHAGDKAVSMFGQPLLPSSICSSWVGSSGTKTVDGTVTMTGANSLKFTTSDPGCPSVQFGTVAFSASYGGDLILNAYLTWNPSASQLKVTVGSLTRDTPTSESSNVMPTYAPVHGLTDNVGNLVPAAAGSVNNSGS